MTIDIDASGFRRLAADHASLHSSGLPPNYFFPPSNGQSSFPDDLRQLTILLAGPPVTPYSQGLWRLHLRIPEDYPKSPPKAAFRTRIWHPNVEESTGAVCVDTLKRDWEPKLTLRDVLIDGFNALSNSERNIAANINYSDRGQRQTLRRKSPKIADPRNSPIIPASPFQSTARLQPASETAHAKGRAEQQLSLSDAHPANNEISKPVIGNTSLKGNVIITNLAPRAQPPSATTAFMPQYSRSPLSGVGTISSKSRPSKPPPPATRKVSTNSVRPKPRTGLRRL
ncbi:ubiquitin-conjugating enzyme E2 S [Coccidioides immitis H538.4]|uniref:Ubiquitin-conjugating enzyme E2 S n=1 Tax=Coccidioides immitis H538.4 TaxID=396776 RepID=A0A0J8UV38_COCIT|nr:ubiquitin-conjugating enzyme E2 S [Coccidioides immitis H538.4]